MVILTVMLFFFKQTKQLLTKLFLKFFWEKTNLANVTMDDNKTTTKRKGNLGFAAKQKKLHVENVTKLDGHENRFGFH